MKGKCKLIGEEEIIARINKEIAKDGLKIVQSNPEDFEEDLENGRFYLVDSSGETVEDEVDIVDIFEELSLVGPDEEIDFASVTRNEIHYAQEMVSKGLDEFSDEDEI